MPELVGEHDPVVMVWGGFWVECECSWIGPTCYSEATALAVHRSHVEKVEAAS